MNDPLLPNSNEPDQARELRSSLENLRSLLQLTMGVLILLIAAVNVYLWHQTILVRQQTATLNRQVEQLTKVVNDYKTNSLPLIQDFSADLLRLAGTDTNIAAVVRKYPQLRSLPAPTNSVAAPAPGSNP